MIPASQRRKLNALLQSLAPFLLLLLSSTDLVWSQEDRVTQLCNNAMNILVTEAGCFPVLNENRRVLEGNNEFLTFFDDEGEKSMWYKLIIDSDCDLEMSIFPTSPTSGYSFFVYKLYGRSEFCEQIINKSIDPVRSNLYRESMASEGIGLSRDYTGSYADSLFALDRQMLYYTPYHPYLEAKANEIYYVNVYRIRGEDCGHLIEFNTCDQRTDFRTINLSCFDPVNMPSIPLDVPLAMQRRAMVRLENIRDIERQLASRKTESNEPEPVREHILKFVVLDSATNKRLNANVSVRHIATSEKQPIKRRKENQYSMVMQEDNNYRISIGAMGYQKQTFTIAINESIETDFLLSPLKKGDKFVLQNIYFQPNTYKIRPESEPSLESLLEFMRSNTNVRIEIQGHTNGKANIRKSTTNPNAFVGDEKKLSKLRAEEIKIHLSKHGISSNRIQTKGMGDKQMLYPRPINSWEADKNKRVEIFLR